MLSLLETKKDKKIPRWQCLSEDTHRAAPCITDFRLDTTAC